MSCILVVDDDLSMREFLELMLSREGYEVDLADHGAKALELVAQKRYDIVISDIRMKAVNGIDVLKGVKAVSPTTVVILISAFATAETAVVAMKEGAYDFIPKPFQIDELKAVIRNALDHPTLEAERRILDEKVKEGCHFGSLVGKSSEMLKIYDLIQRAAQTNTNILITGESGTGKELIARAIHEHSPRSKEQFVAINCGGMPEQLIESELFGYKKGAFTGATIDKQGLFELANKGSIFLDEVAELSLPMQVKLLRVVQDRTYRAVGGTQEKSLDVRIIAATNKNLEKELMAGNFREDLYYRLNVINLHMPPLRDRKGDIPLLAQFFLHKYSRSMGKEVIKISSYALDILSNYSFPGNVRELENIIERSVALEKSNIILPESLTLASYKHQRRFESFPREDHSLSNYSEPKPMPSTYEHKYESDPGWSESESISTSPFLPSRKKGLDPVLGELEKKYLLLALKSSDGSKKETARLLSISPWRLRNRLSSHNLNNININGIDEEELKKQTITDIPEYLLPNWSAEGIDLDKSLLSVEKYLLEEALTRAGGSKTEAADMLGITRRTFHHRMIRSGAVDKH